MTLTNLKPDTRYYYVFGSNVTGFSKEYSFQTRPLKNTNKTFIFYGDMASDFFPRAVATMNNILAEPRVDFVLHAGDLAYSMVFKKNFVCLKGMKEKL